MTLEELPKFEMYEQGSQIRRSSKGIPANIVEGFGRKRYQQDYLRFLVMAHASCNETIEHLEILFDTGALKNQELFNSIFQKYDLLGRKLNKFISTIRK